MEDLKLVREFLTSKEGQEWLESNSYVLEEIKKYIIDMTPIDKKNISSLIRFFPEFSITQKAYRFISAGKEENLAWKEGFDNLSWSKHMEAYKYVLRSLSYKDQKIQIYKATVSGLDLHSFVLCFSDYYSSFLPCLAHTEDESEILAVSYNNLELVKETSN